MRRNYGKMTKGLKKAGVTSVHELYGEKPVEEKPRKRTLIGIKIALWKSRQEYKKSIREGVKSGLIEDSPRMRKRITLEGLLEKRRGRRRLKKAEVTANRSLKELGIKRGLKEWGSLKIYDGLTEQERKNVSQIIDAYVNSSKECAHAEIKKRLDELGIGKYSEHIYNYDGYRWTAIENSGIMKGAINFEVGRIQDLVARGALDPNTTEKN